MKVKRWLLRQYYKLWDHDGLLCIQHTKGKFRVKYPDGQVSAPFSYRTACNYRNIFGGEVIDNF